MLPLSFFLKSKLGLLIRVLTVIITANTLIACSSAKNTNRINTSFNTRISESGLKHFELRERTHHRVRTGQTSPPQARNQRDREISNPARQYEKALVRLRKKAEEMIEENLYCRTGFLVLDFNSDTVERFLRGECNEIATDADRVNFPDTIKFW